MSADSLFGGSTDLTQIVDQESLDLINNFLTDTVGGSNITGAIDGSTIMFSSGHDGEIQGALLPIAEPITGTIDDGQLQLSIHMPAGTGFVSQGKSDMTPDEMATFLSTIVDEYLAPGQGHDDQREALNNAITDLVNSIEAQGLGDVVVRMVDFVTNNAPGAGEILFDATGSAGNELFALNLTGLNADQTLVLQGVENVMVAGAGTVRIEGDVGVRITSDNTDQNITGGGGNDTLMGGGGHDTLTGGVGDDVFGFSHPGNYEITDFGTTNDVIGFNLPGVTNLDQLLPLVTGVTETDAGVTYEFGSMGLSITLVGVSASDLTADLIKFTF